MKKIIAFLLVISLLFCFCLCGTKKYTGYSFDYFDTVTTVIGYAKNQKEFNDIKDRIFSELSEYHRLFDIYKTYEGIENLCTLNRERTIEADSRILDMLTYAKEMYEKTNGKLNISMGSVLSVWHDYRKEGKTLPPSELLTEASLHMNPKDLLIDSENGTVTLTDSGMLLDVGAVAKGYAAEMTAQMLEEDGISGYIINIGGNVRTVGTHGDGNPWTVGIENPLKGGEDYLAYLSFSGESLVTSGSYQRYYIVDGKEYHHIIDPETLMPSEYFLSVSVVCRDSAAADALSTALFCMPFEEGLSLVESIPETEALWLYADGTQKTSSGFSNYCFSK
ncbi:MAG: FAD:protein FMN transferase [Clostridia bacterium]|nr:FAD:protein FMN transferase [Clostridia bacterium]